MRVARELVVFLKRSGAQAQFSMPLQMQSGASGQLSEVCKWAASHLNADLSVDALASRAGLSSRQFARRFREAYAIPPAAYIERLRLDGDSAGGTLLRTPIIDQQGLGRLPRGQHFFSFSKDRAEALGAEFRWSLQIVPNVGHDYMEMSSVAAKFLYE